MAALTFHFYAAARAAAGVPSVVIDAGCIDDALATLCERYDDWFAVVVKGSSVLLDGVRVEDGTQPLLADAEVHVLPPFAGG